MRQTIFEPFFTTKNRAGSSGLGLATVAGVLEGQGITFVALFPRSQGVPVPITARPPARAAIRATAERSILLVEDNPEMRVATVEMLEAAGYTVTAVGDPVAAVETWRRSDPAFDLLITDVVLPGMSGQRLADRIRESTPGLSVLFVSGHVVGSSPESDARDEPFPLLRKPFSMDELLDAIDALAPLA